MIIGVIDLRKQQQIKPHLEVTVKFNGTSQARVIKCEDVIYNVRQFILLDEEGEPLLYADRSIAEIICIKPVE